MHKRLFYQVMFCIVLSTVSTMFQVKPNILVCFLALYCKLFASLDTKSICNDVNANMVQMFGLGLFALTYGVVSAHFPTSFLPDRRTSFSTHPQHRGL